MLSMKDIRRMKILIPLFTPPSGAMGPHTRGVSLGETAQQQGHSVAYCASGEVYQRFKEKGRTVYEIPEPTLLGLPPFFSSLMIKLINTFRPPVRRGKSFGNIWLVLLLMGVIRKKYLTRLVSAEISAIETFKPDVLFTELDPAAYLVSDIKNIPLVTTYASVARKGIGSLPYKMIERRMHAILARYGKAGRSLEELCFGPHILKIVPSIPALEQIAAPGHDMLFVGNLLPVKKNTGKPSFSPVKNKKYIFVYMGMGSLHFSLIQKMLPRVFAGDGEYRCIVASENIRQPFSVAGVDFCSYIDADELLPHCEWTMCHGGHNTIIQSLLYKVPLLLFPGMVFERRFNAEMVQKAGAGFLGEPGDFNSRWIREKLALRQQLSANIETLNHSLRSYHGPVDALDAITRVHKNIL